LSASEPSESPDIYDASLKGTTYRVYRYMYRAGKPVRVNDVQRDLKLSSPSVAQYHLKKLLRLGLVKEVPEGYAIDKVIYENMVRIGRVTIPFQAAFVAFFAACVLVLVTFLRPGVLTSTYVFALGAIVVALAVTVYETWKTLTRLR
jgi:hypothetical protein